MSCAVIAFVTVHAWVDPPTAWRITPSRDTGDMGDAWTVREFQVYPTADCSGPPLCPSGRGTLCITISKDASNTNNRQRIIDGNPKYPNTEGDFWRGFHWRMDAFQDWVGFQLKVSATPAFGQCARVMQCARSGCAPQLMIQSRAGGAEAPWVDIFDFPTAGDGEWTQIRWTNSPFPPALPPPTPPPTPTAPQTNATAGAAQSTNDQGLSVGTIAGIAVGGAVGLALVLGLCGVSVYICREMNRGLKDAKHGAKQGPRNSKNSAQGAELGKVPPA